MIMDLLQALSLLEQLPIETKAIESNEVLAHYLSDFALRFVPGSESSISPLVGQARFWLFLPFATVRDFPCCSADQVHRLALASTFAIIYNILFDAVLDDPGGPDITIQVLADDALARLHEQLYTLFPAGSLFWDYYRPLYERFLQSMVEERIAHKGRPQPYSYSDFERLAQGKMSMALLNPVGQAVLDGTPERIPALQAAWDELNVAVVIMDDIADWEEDFRQGNFTYLLSKALHIEYADQLMPQDEESLFTQVVFSGAMESLYRQGVAHLERAAELARAAKSDALAALASERANMFRKFGRQLFHRKLAALHQHLAGPTTIPTASKEEVP